jgi:diguanylate cyclase (GGDEF)-like protein
MKFRALINGLRFSAQLTGGLAVLAYCLATGAHQLVEYWYLGALFAAGYTATTVMPFSVIRFGAKSEFAAETMFIVASALALPTQIGVIAVVGGTSLAWLIRRDLDWSRADDTASSAISAFLALTAAHSVGQIGINTHGLAGAVIAALIYDPLTLLLLAVAIRSYRPIKFWAFIRECMSMELVIWPFLVSCGVLLGALATATPLALPLTVAPMALIFLASRARVEATEDHSRLDGLLRATTAILEATTISAVIDAATEASVALLESQSGRIDTEPPREGELGAALVTEKLGVLSLIAGNRPALMRGYTERDQRLLETLASVAASALDKAVQHENVNVQATTDQLTGLANRRSFEQRVSLALKSRRSGDGAAIIFVDLDRFKQINDEHGHQAGDEVLVEAAARLSAAVRGGDFVARLGGDEFTLLLRGVQTPDDAVLVAERVLALMRKPIALSCGVQVQTTPSIGIALAADPEMDPGQLLKDADAAMYEAKRAGKDCWRIADPRPFLALAR